MPKNLVICCDGTSNQFGPTNSNVVKLYQVLGGDEQQLAYYDPGVGTVTSYESFIPGGKTFKGMLGLGFALGLTKNIQDAYRFLMQNYGAGDKVYLFGFSRGAYTARAVAAMLHKCGLLPYDNENLIPEATRIFKTLGNAQTAREFKQTFSRDCDVHFLGLWDTVTSVGQVWNPPRLPCTSANSSVSIVRHAISMDETRAFFRANRWVGKPHSDKELDPNYVVCHDPNDPREQDVKQVWFAGTHGDIGGGYTQQESSLAQIGLEWMLVEATEAGLEIDDNTARNVLNSPPPSHLMTPPHSCHAHHSLGGLMRMLWAAAEYWPKRSSYKKPDGTWGKTFKTNRWKPRWISDNEFFHESVQRRLNELDDYRPVNLPWKSDGSSPPTIPASQIEPWKRLPGIQINEPAMSARIEARKRSNPTPFKLEKGKTYRFAAEGTWLDAGIVCDASGYTSEEAKSKSWILSRTEGWRRVPEAKWFSLIGRVGNSEYQQIDIGKLIESAATYQAESTGLLHCFANDVSWMYWNNKGAVTLYVEEVA